jgi:hypothetical protein
LLGIYLMISKVQITYLWTPHYNGKKDIWKFSKTITK